MLTTPDCTHSNLNKKNFVSVLLLNSWEIISYIFKIFAKGEYIFTKKETKKVYWWKPYVSRMKHLPAALGCTVPTTFFART